MKVLFVVQRFGPEVAGGAEFICREFAHRMAARGHHVEALTSCARSYVDWADVDQPGTSDDERVTVHRLPVREARSDRFFGPLNARVVHGRKPVPLYLQHEWMRRQGPELVGLREWIAERAGDFDVALFYTYLYFTTWAGLPAAAARVPTVLQPAAHDEPPLYLPLWDTLFRMPRAFAFNTPEEAALVRRRFRIDPPHDVVGHGIDLQAQGDGARFREVSGLGDRPYLLFVGRLDPGKGTLELFDFFLAYKERNPGPLQLVLLGDPVHPLPDHPDVHITGFVDEQTKRDAIDGCLALVHPSYFESFSLVVVEAFAQGKPALVQGACDVLVGHALRSRGGLPFRGFAEFETAVGLLVDDPDHTRRMGEAAREYAQRYDWDSVMNRYERLLSLAPRV